MRTPVAALGAAFLLAACSSGTSDHSDHSGRGTGPEPTGPVDRTVTVVAKDFSFTGLSGFSAKTGEVVRFELDNDGQAEHELRFRHDGDVVASSPHAGGGRSASVVVAFARAGTYTYLCEIGGHDKLGMKGTFTVA